MTISIADTSQGVFLFCDEESAKLLREQIGFVDINGEWDLPSCIYVIALPDAYTEPIIEMTGNPPPIEIEQEAMRDAISRIRGR